MDFVGGGGGEGGGGGKVPLPKVSDLVSGRGVARVDLLLLSREIARRFVRAPPLKSRRDHLEPRE